MRKPGSEPVCLGEIVGPQGLKGEVRIKTFTEDPANLTAYGALFDDAGKRLSVAVRQIRTSSLVIAAIEGCVDRNQAEAMVGKKLYIHREQLSETDDGEYYYHDLMGMTVIDEQDVVIGQIMAVENYGAGEFLEIIDGFGKVYTIPFSQDAVLMIDVVVRIIHVQRSFLLG